MSMVKSFFDPGLWLLAYDYVALKNESQYGWHYASLAEPFWRIYWIDATGAAVQVGKRTLPLHPGRLYVIPPNVDYSSSHHGNCRQLYIHFQLRHPCTLSGPPIIILPMTKQRRDFVRRIIAGHGATETIQRRVTLLVHAFIETLISDLMDQHVFFHRIDLRLLNALNYIGGHLDQSINNAKLAASMHIHPQSMLRLFKNELGKAPQAYLRQMRVEKACWLLRFSNETSKKIGEDTGFCDRYHFTKIFIKSTGQSPARFRAGHA